MMPKYLRLPLSASFIGLALVAMPSVLWAQSYPTKPVRLIVPFPPGSGVDVLSRVIAPTLAEQLGQQVITEPPRLSLRAPGLSQTAIGN